MKKIITVIMILVLMLSFASCGKKEQPTVTPEATPASDGATATVKPTATLAPTATVQATKSPDVTKAPDATKTPEPENALNIVPSKSSNFDDAKNIEETGWKVFSETDTGTVTLVEDGIDGTKCIKYAPEAGNKETWYGPCINLRPFVKEAGEHMVTFDFKSETASPSWLIRGMSKDDESSFIQQNQTNHLYYFISEPVMEEHMQEGWKTVTLYFVVEEDDLQGSENDNWLFVPDRLNVVTDMVLYIDNFVIENNG